MRWTHKIGTIEWIITRTITLSTYIAFMISAHFILEYLMSIFTFKPIFYQRKTVKTSNILAFWTIPDSTILDSFSTFCALFLNIFNATQPHLMQDITHRNGTYLIQIIFLSNTSLFHLQTLHTIEFVFAFRL